MSDAASGNQLEARRRRARGGVQRQNRLGFERSDLFYLCVSVAFFHFLPNNFVGICQCLSPFFPDPTAECYVAASEGAVLDAT